MTDQILAKAKARQKVVDKKLKEAEKGKDWEKIRKQLRVYKSTDLVAFNQLADEYFVHLVRELLAEVPGNKVKTVEVQREASYEIGVSTETVKRYLLQHSARRAEFRVFQGYVFLNPNYVSRDDDQEEDARPHPLRPSPKNGDTSGTSPKSKNDLGEEGIEE